MQLAVLSATFRVIATDLDGGYALVSGRLRGRLAGPARARRFDRITGSLLIGAGLWLAAARRG